MSGLIGQARPATTSIQNWQPPDWESCVGNGQLKWILRSLALGIRDAAIAGRIGGHLRPNLLIHGPSRSGKTSIVNLFARCLLCERFDRTRSAPCDGSCPTCRLRPEVTGSHGIERAFATPEGSLCIHFVVVDCTMIGTPAELRDRVLELRDYSGLRVVYFDEAHRLKNRAMDEILLKQVEQKDFMWILSTAYPEELEPMFQRRFIKVRTKPPTDAELDEWIARRCKELGIRCEPEAVIRLSEKCNRIPGTALEALAMAALPGQSGLTLDLVESGWTPAEV